MNRILLIDGNSIFFRAYYGTAYGKTGVLKTSFGMPVNAVLTFNNMVSRYIQQHYPTHVYIAFDTGKPTFRHYMKDDYKAGRSETPDDMKPQWAVLFEMLDSMNIKYGSLVGIEADDIISLLKNKFSENSEVLIVSSDKDLHQLIDNNTSIVSPQSGYKEDVIITADNFFDKFGINPNQIIDYKGIKGDPSDNLPGVKGVGDKGAVKLLGIYGTLEEVYKNLDDLTESMKKKFVEYKEMAFMCKDMARLLKKMDDQPIDMTSIDISLNEMEFIDQYEEKYITFLEKYEMKSVINRYKDKIKSSNNNEWNIEF